MNELLIVLSVLALSSIKALAWDGVATNTIAKVDVPLSGENYGFRVYLDGLPSLCGNTHNWAYINKSDDNHDAMVSVLLAAHLAGRKVTLYSNRAASGYCHLGYVTLY